MSPATVCVDLPGGWGGRGSSSITEGPKLMERACVRVVGEMGRESISLAEYLEDAGNWRF